MKILITEKEWRMLQDEVSPYTDLVPLHAERKGNKIEIELRSEDWDELNGFIAAVANHTESKTVEKVLDALYFRIDEKLNKINE